MLQFSSAAAALFLTHLSSTNTPWSHSLQSVRNWQESSNTSNGRDTEARRTSEILQLVRDIFTLPFSMNDLAFDHNSDVSIRFRQASCNSFKTSTSTSILRVWLKRMRERQEWSIYQQRSRFLGILCSTITHDSALYSSCHSHSSRLTGSDCKHDHPSNRLSTRPIPQQRMWCGAIGKQGFYQDKGEGFMWSKTC